ncbi:MAG: hypothetical protein IKJ74_05055 [Clostridia bacterium]|nr:hypothetical protein [Clostridia bacterium]
MEGDFSQKLQQVLSDPNAMATIAGLAQNFSKKNAESTGASETSLPTGAGEAPREKGVLGEMLEQPAIASALKMLGDGSRERVALLQAMRPFVKDEKKERLDRIIQTMKTLDLLLSAQKLL